MGYYTAYSLNYKEQGTPEVDLKVAKALVGCEYFDGYAADLEGLAADKVEQFIDNLISSDTMKWYDHNEDMLEVSRLVPDVTFILEGQGEDYTDVWRTYYRNGEMEYCEGEIVYPEPSEYFTV